MIAEGAKELDKIRASRKTMWVYIAHPNYVGKSIPSLGNFQAVDFDIIDKDIENDVALLKLRLTFEQIRSQGRRFIVSANDDVPSLSVKAAVLNLQDLQDGVQIGVSGYPLDQPVLISTSGHLASRWSLGILRVPGGSSIPTVRDAYLADIHVNSGNSGGPAYLIPDGSVVGLCVAYRGDYARGADGKPVPFTFNSGLAQIIPAKYIANILKKNNVIFSESFGQNKE